MGRSRARRTTAIVAVSAAIHVLLLSALAIEVTRPGPARTAEQTAVQVTLERLPKPPPKTKPSPAKSRQTQPAPSVTPRFVAAPQAIAPAQPLAPAAPRVDAGEAAAMGDVVRALRGSVGCAHPDAAGLSAAERAKCPRQFVSGGEGVKPLSGLTAEKRARFDQALHCYHDYYAAPVPPGPAPSNGAGGMPGLGYIPSMKECPRLAQ